MVIVAVESGIFSECGYSSEFEDNVCTIYSFLPEDGSNRTTVVISAIGAVAFLGLFYLIRKSSERSGELNQSSFPIKLPLMPEFDEEILIEGGKGMIHIVGTWSENEIEYYDEKMARN